MVCTSREGVHESMEESRLTFYVFESIHGKGGDADIKSLVC